MEHNIYYCLCNHWTESGIGYAFVKGWYHGVWYDRCFSSIYTIEKMLDAADAYPGLIVCMELDSYTYEQVQLYAPDTLKRLKTYIKEGKAAVEGGTYGQPLGQDYGGESNIAHLTYGKKILKELLEYDIKTFLVEEQWFHPQLPQLLAQCGFLYASLQCQNSGQVMPIEKNMFLWEGADGTRIKTIPSNSHMISCVKQYGDYEYLWDELNRCHHPLLFQWAEVWVPGMDWGASIAPFEKGIQYAAQQGAVSISLQGYFEKEAHQAVDVVEIPLDDSHYGNDWYQDGGWGFDGDQILYENKQCENWMQAYEAYRFYEENENDASTESFWKRLLVLQNHDVSVARGYRAIDEDGIMSDANSLFLKKLRELKQDIIQACYQSGTRQKLISYNGAIGYKTYELSCTEADIHVYSGGSELPVSYQSKKNILFVSVPLKPYQSTEITMEKGDPHQIKQHQGNSITYESIRLVHEYGWCIRIEDLISLTKIHYRAFSGSIGKRNEHDDHFHALSSAHYQFTFAFDGFKHCSDQCSEQYVKLESISEDDLFITMTLSCDLLTLHTSDTPVAFAKSEVRINKTSKEITTLSYLYCGVYLNMDAYASFTYDLDQEQVIRNYPFGEESTSIHEIYALDYIRVCNEHTGFTIMNYGNQRVIRNGKELRFKISKGKMFLDYHFHFGICFHTKTGIDSIKYVQREQLVPLSTSNEKIVVVERQEVRCSSIFRAKRKDHFRFVNYSDQSLNCIITLPKAYQYTGQCDFLGQRKQRMIQNKYHQVCLHFHPWEIITVIAYD